MLYFSFPLFVPLIDVSPEKKPSARLIKGIVPVRCVLSGFSASLYLLITKIIKPIGKF